MQTSKDGPELNDDKNNTAYKEANATSEKNNLTSKTERGKEDIKEANVVLVEDLKDGIGNATTPELLNRPASPELLNTVTSPELLNKPTAVLVENMPTSSKDVDVSRYSYSATGASTHTDNFSNCLLHKWLMLQF